MDDISIYCREQDKYNKKQEKLKNFKENPAKFLGIHDVRIGENK